MRVKRRLRDAFDSRDRLSRCDPVLLYDPATLGGAPPRDSMNREGAVDHPPIRPNLKFAL